jgi:hypothetical protein
MCVYIILHNMIINDEHGDSFNENYHAVTNIVAPPVNYNAPTCLASCLQREVEMTLGLMFSQLQLDLIEHVWNKYHHH